MTKLTCTQCGKEYEITGRSVSYLKTRKFCSRKCYRDCPNKGGVFKVGHTGMIAENNPMWKGGRRKTVQGYIEKRVGIDKKKLEHRCVMEKLLGRKLERRENVHHKDGDKTNNSIDNLELLDVSDHTRLHHKLRVCARYL